MDGEKARATGICVGGVVADAACTPLHWMYFEEAVERALGASIDDCASGASAARVSFFDVPSGPFFRVPVGENSPFGDQVVHLLSFLRDNKGPFDAEAYSRSLAEWVGPGSKYDAEAAPRVDGRVLRQSERGDWPLNYLWTNTPVADFRKRVSDGSSAWPYGSESDEHMDGVCKAGAVVGWLLARDATTAWPSVERMVLDVVRTTQQNVLVLDSARAHAWACYELWKSPETTVKTVLDRALAELELHEPVQAAIRAAIAVHDGTRPVEITAAEGTPGFTRATHPHVRAVAMLGKSCGLPGAYSSSLHAALWAESHELDLHRTVDLIALAGGANSGRAAVVAQLFAAKGAAIPAPWLDAAKHSSIARDACE
jgi:hypothetical protein